MPREIDTTTGQAAVFTTGTPPWHGLGTTIEQAATSAEAITLAGLDWEVEQWPLEAMDPQTWKSIKAPNHLANVRTDTRAVLGVVSPSYHVFQNREAFDFFDAIVGDKLAMYETTGSLRGGRRVWMLARIPKEYRATPEDVVQPYVLLVNSHDGSLSLRMIPTTVRVVCQNTLHLALSGTRGEGITIAHRPSLEDRVKEARAKLGIVAARFDAFDEELHAMLDRDLKTKELEAYFASVLPKPKPAQDTDAQAKSRAKTLDVFRGNFEHDTNTLPGVSGTAWAAYNAVSQWADHQRKFRGQGDKQRAENRLRSIWFGSSNDVKQKAYRHAVRLTRN